MSEIIVKCPTCGKCIKVNIKTIDTLREELKSITISRDHYKKQTEKIDMPDNFGDLFGKMFKK